jgi:hypothetical protein
VPFLIDYIDTLNPRLSPFAIFELKDDLIMLNEGEKNITRLMKLAD